MKREQQDLELLMAIGELKAAVRGLPTGRVFVEVHRLGGETVDHRVQPERMTEEEIQRLMSQPPCPRRLARETARRSR